MDGSALESITLKASTVLSVLLLQETFPPFKTEGSFSLPGETPA